MASPPPLLKPKRSFRKSLRKQWDKFISGQGSRPSSPSPSQQSMETPVSQSPPLSPLPVDLATQTPTSDPGVLSTEQAAPGAQPSPTSLQVPGASPAGHAKPAADPPTIVVTGSPNASAADLGFYVDPGTSTTKQTTSVIWTGLGTALRALQDTTGLFPPLHSAISTLIPCLNILEVSFAIYKQLDCK